jgi:hypothetical protein
MFCRSTSKYSLNEFRIGGLQNCKNVFFSLSHLPSQDQSRILKLMPFIIFGYTTLMPPKSPFLLSVCTSTQYGQNISWRLFRCSHKETQPMFPFAVVGAIFILPTGTLLVMGFMTLWNKEQPGATAAYDHFCNAVHVALTPWRYFPDVNAYGRALRVARL